MADKTYDPSDRTVSAEDNQKEAQAIDATDAAESSTNEAEVAATFDDRDPEDSGVENIDDENIDGDTDEGENDENNENSASEGNKGDFNAFIFGILIPIAIGLTILIFFTFQLFSTDVASNGKDLTIHANAEQISVPSADKSYAEWLVTGVVTSKDDLVAPPKVTAILIEESQNRFIATEPTQSDVNSDGKPISNDGFRRGKFTIKIKQSLSVNEVKNPPVKEVIITAHGTKDSFFSVSKAVEGATTINLARKNAGEKAKEASAKPLLGSLILLGLTIVISLWHTPNASSRKAIYYAAVVFSLFYTTAMIMFMSVTTDKLGFGAIGKGDPISLGVATVVYGKYKDANQPELLISLTTPQELVRSLLDDSDKKNLTEKDLIAKKLEIADPPSSKGFGAPLWTLFLSVLGSAIFMVKLIADNLRTEIVFDYLPNNSTPDAEVKSSKDPIRDRVSELVRHQTYILFAPIGAVFVYQLLLVAGDTSEPVTVGLAALASGITLNSILERAWKQSKATVETKPE